MQDRFSRFEERIQQLVEGGFARLFAGRLHPREVAVRLAHAMEDHAQADASGQRIAPDIFVIRLNPQDHAAILDSEPQIVRSLAEELVELAQLTELALTGFPEVRLLADSDVEPHKVEINAQMRGQRVETTEALMIEPSNIILPDASLIIDERIIPLDRPIINLGRQRENHIIIDDSRVSRHHAQMRVRFGHYVLFDLGSSGGTTVNEQPVREAILHSGDVIALAGVRLIYVEDSDPSQPPDGGDTLSGTQPYTPIL